ncbi:MAG: Ig domain-containing protein [Limisphaerales bacterium]
MAATSAWSADVTSFSLFKGECFVQVAGLGSATPDTSGAYEFLAMVRGSESNALVSATLTGPGGVNVDLSYDGLTASWSEQFDTQADLDASYPAGDYVLDLVTADDGNQSPQLVLAAGSFPPAPFIDNSGSASQIDPNSDLPLAWEPFTGAASPDCIRVSVEDVLGQEIFATPDPGLPGALLVTAANVTIPASTWTNGAASIGVVYLKVRFVNSQEVNTTAYPEAAGVAGYCATTALMGFLAAAPSGPDLAQYALLRGSVHVQTNASSPPGLATNAFVFEAAATASGASRLNGVSIQASGAPAIALATNADGINFTFQDTRASQAALDADHPPGNYTWQFDGANDGTVTVPMTLANTAFPPAPIILNFDQAQSFDATNAFALQWQAWDDGTTNDFIQLIIADNYGDEAYRTPDWWDFDDRLTGVSTGFIIPAGQLGPDQYYQARLRFLKQTTLDTDTYPGTVGLAGCFTETDFTLSTAPPPPPFSLVPLTNAVAATVGGEFSWFMDTAHGQLPVSWGLVSGLLPPGLTLDPVTGEIYGYAATNGTWTVVLGATDSLGNAAQESVTLRATGSVQALTLFTTNLPLAMSGICYVGELAATGGVPPYRWSLAQHAAPLPAGLTLDPDTGLIGGTPTAEGVTTLGLVVTDARGQTSSTSLTLSILPSDSAPPLQITDIVCGRGGTVTLQAQGDTNLVCTVEASPDLKTWTALLSTNTLVQNGVSFPAAGQQMFYRILMGLPPSPASPINVQPLLETYTNGATVTTNAASLWLTSAGGELSLTNALGTVFTLDIPTNALLVPEQIRMSAVGTVGGLPLSGSLAGAVQLEPEGLYLFQPASLTITPTNTLTGTNACFSWSGSGLDFSLNLFYTTNNSLVCPIFHFSGHGGGGATPADLSAILGNTPCQKAAAAISQILRQEKLAYYTGKSQNSSPGDFATFFYPIFKEWFESSIRPKLKAAETDDSLLPAAVSEYFNWGRMMQLLDGDDATSPEGAKFFPKEIAWSLLSLARSHLNAINQAHLRAVDEYQPFEAGRILYWARSAQLLSLDQYLPGVFDMAAIADRVQRVFRFEVDFESVLEADYPPSAGQGPPSCTSGQCPVHVTQHARAGKAVLQLDDGLLCWIMASSPLEQLDWSVSAWGSSFRVDTSRPPLRGRVYSVYYEYLKILTDPEPDSQEPNQDPCAVLAPPPLARPTGITLLGAVGDAGDGQVLGDNGWGYVDAFNFGFLWRALNQDIIGPLVTCNGEGGLVSLFFHQDWSINGGHLFARMVSDKSATAPQGLSISGTTIIDLWHAPLPPSH